MKIYLSTTKPNDTRKWANSLPMLDGLVLNSEAIDITCDNFLSSFDIREIEQLLHKISEKMRIRGILTLVDIDMNITSRRFYTEEINIEKLNTILFEEQKRKCFLTMELIEFLLPKNLTIEYKHYDQNTCRFILKCRRTS